MGQSVVLKCSFHTETNENRVSNAVCVCFRKEITDMIKKYIIFREYFLENNCL